MTEPSDPTGVPQQPAEQPAVQQPADQPLQQPIAQQPVEPQVQQQFDQQAQQQFAQPVQQPMVQQPVHHPVPMAPYPSYSAQFGVAPVPMNNNLGWAIAGILVCWPFGIPSLIKALQVNSLWYQGLPDQAQLSANEAKKWGKVAVIVGASLLGLYILAIVAYFVIMIALFGFAATQVD
ncbi:CD225/dispanin family protein [Saccharopolyspora shandongensis]|uniref:CD225/dispanin family protein n=1 Tax=Saccharopolyspora shandongensis TaxID=418495 RepID=UPI003408114E